MTKTEVAEVEKPQVPALAQTPAIDIGAEDVALPRVYIGQFMSQHVKDQVVPVGSIFTALSKDDPEPQVLWEQGDEGGVRFHVLAMRKGRSVSEGGELILFDYNDPDAPPDAWVTYNYVVVLPKVDDQVPYKWLLTRTGKPAAQQINTVLVKNAEKGPPQGVAFEATASKRQNEKGEFYVPRIRHTEADPEDAPIVEKLGTMLSADAATVTAENDEPDI